MTNSLILSAQSTMISRDPKHAKLDAIVHNLDRPECNFHHPARRIAILVLLWIWALGGLAGAAEVEWTTPTLEQKIRGAWAGKMMGVLAGTPAEFRACGKMYTGPLGWDLPTTVSLLQDDLYVNMVFLEVVEREGVNATQSQFADAFRDSQFGLYHANLAARRNLLMGIPPPRSGSPPWNLHAEDIDFQIESDFIGLLCPGMPRAASDMAFRVGPIMNAGDGVYGGVFVANLYALAFVESDPVRLVERALESLPPESGYRQCVETVLKTYRANPENWKIAWKAVQDQWDGDDRCPGGVGSPFNIDAKINGAYVATALLYGGKDPVRTVEIGTRCGQDADCNPSTAAGVLATMIGYSALPESWRQAVEAIEDRPFSNVSYSLNTVTKATLKGALSMVREQGGTVEGDRVKVEVLSPTAPQTVEQWDDGRVPRAAIPYLDSQWKWTGEWVEGVLKKERFAAARDEGARGMIEFDGAAVLLVGCLFEAGGQMEIQLDDRDPEIVEAYLFARGQMPWIYPQEGLWYSGAIEPGHHTLRIHALGKKRPESRGTLVGIQMIIVYDAEPVAASGTQ